MESPVEEAQWSRAPSDVTSPEAGEDQDLEHSVCIYLLLDKVVISSRETPAW